MKLELITQTRWLKFFTRIYVNKNGREAKWDFVSRKENPDKPQKNADAVVIVAILKGKLVLIKQFRAPIYDYLIECPAGLIDIDETPLDAAKREFEEETGLILCKCSNYPIPTYNSAGITDESVCYVIGNAEGEISTSSNEESEDIQVLTVDKNEALKLLVSKDQKISSKCFLVLLAYAAGFDWR